MTWRFYAPCATCKTGWPVPPNFSGVTKAGPDSVTRVICQNCGDVNFYPPRSGRFVPAPWWKFWTKGHWEYRDDTVIPWPWQKDDGGGDDDRDKTPPPDPSKPKEATPDAADPDLFKTPPPIEMPNREEPVA